MQMAGGGGSFLGAAQQGMFAVDTTAGHDMVMSISQMQDRLELQLNQIFAFKTQAKLSVPATSAVADAWTAEVGVGVGDLATVLREAGEALAQTVAEYDRADTSSAHDFQRILRDG